MMQSQCLRLENEVLSHRNAVSVPMPTGTMVLPLLLRIDRAAARRRGAHQQHHAGPVMSFPFRSSLSLVLLATALGTASAFAAEEPSGCDKFKWDITRARAALTAPDRTKVASGNEFTALPASGFTLGLVTPADAKLPMPPERAPKDGTFAGLSRVMAAPKPGLYTISLSAGAWIDVVQDGHTLKPEAFSGATDCDGIRKTMKYELAAKPFVLQISGARDNAISVAILPAE
jgi:hypothetical protein